MGVFSNLFGFTHKDSPELQAAIDRAVSGVEPLLKQTHEYPDAYRKPVITALEYAHKLVQDVPGPVTVDLDAYAKDAFVHAIFPSMDLVSEAFKSSLSIQDYLRDHPATSEIYALMGMRRIEKTMMGLELSGQLIQHDVPQHVVYFISHTIENPASTEQQAKEQIVWSFFDSLIRKVAKRVASRKQEIKDQIQEKDMLIARLHVADIDARPALEAELSKMLSSIQNAARSIDLHSYLGEFEDVLLNPEHHLRLDQHAMILDSMGIRRDSGQEETGKPIVFNDLIGFDRRDWTVTMVHCRDIHNESFASRLETAYRRLSI